MNNLFSTIYRDVRIVTKKTIFVFQFTNIIIYEALHPCVDTFAADDHNSGYFFLPETSQHQNEAYFHYASFAVSNIFHYIFYIYKS